MAFLTLIERENSSSDLIPQGYCDTNGYLLLESYADTFKREQTFATKATIAKTRAEFNGHYNSVTREIAIKEVLQAIRDSQDGWNHNAWAGNFITAFDDIENQLEEIQKARREIFGCDISSNRDCDIDIQLGQTDRKQFDWSVNDPGMIRYQSLTIWDENGEARRLD
ncbi:hypothetical protein BHYA_0165g00140 [Botrytis hyacinthi]|uniref:Uncharacterized protein n=1 Tax=Botrytis hyacinthi TaxID=278943 RepID=A0A4Z1GIE1_9HELO|nr:hypothetical protein BHYA_0165g00140 [Botrytis hyacinthi]